MAKFIIYAGLKFESDVILISSDGVTGEQLDPNDTGVITITTAGVNPECVLANIPMTVTDADNGIFTLTLTAEETSLLKQDLGFKEDGYRPIGNYTGFMEFNLVSGDRQVEVLISVKEVAQCPIS